MRTGDEGIQRKYKGDRQKLNEELMKFYRENKITGCRRACRSSPRLRGLHLALPRARTLLEARAGGLRILSVALHQSPDITAKANSIWSGYLLLAIYAASQVLSTYFMSTTMDKAQRTIMMVVPLVFITVVAHFPIGLVIYWVTTNLWTVGQGLITRRLVPKTPAPACSAAPRPPAGRRAKTARTAAAPRRSRGAEPPPQPRA
jgi:YidC/Oxa1 family membrane protein insertase